MILLGLSYWKLDEKDMYHSLPENFGNEFTDIFSTKVSPDQVDSVHVLKVVLYLSSFPFSTNGKNQPFRREVFCEASFC